jgi:hypothetical protein
MMNEKMKIPMIRKVATEFLSHQEKHLGAFLLAHKIVDG